MTSTIYWHTDLLVCPRLLDEVGLDQLPSQERLNGPCSLWATDMVREPRVDLVFPTRSAHTLT